MRERAGREHEREREQRDGDEPLPAPAPRRNELGEDVQVREGDRVLRPPPVDDDGERDQQRDASRAADSQGEREVHPVAHLTPTCTCAWALAGSASLALIATCTFVPTCLAFTRIAVANPGGGGAVAC